MAVAELKIDLIRIDGGTQARARIDQDTVADYAAKYAAKEDMPPVVVYFDGADHWLADGFHRYHAASQAELKKISADCRKGTQRDAILYACGANSSHGLKRSNADKRKAVGILLADPEWAKKSDRWIADIAVVGNHLVAEVRSEIESRQVGENPPEPKKRLGRDGKEQSAKKPAKGGDQKADSESQVGRKSQSDNVLTDSDQVVSEPEPGPRKLLDANGRDLPPAVRPAFERQQEFNAALQLCRDLADAIKALGEISPFLHVQSCTADLNNAKQAIKFAKPYAVCPYCKGKKCQACKQTGWVPKNIYEQAPEEKR